MLGTMRSKKIYSNGNNEELENIPLISPSQESEEELGKVSSRSAVNLIRQ